MPGTASRFLPMQTAGIQHFIERTHREGGVFQWVRETFINAVEAGTTRIEFGVEWQAVENLGVYRRTIADNGRGMTADELVEFFNTYGGGGKPIGGLHENFGVGAKTSLLPWNRYGLVVVSWVEGEPSMIWVRQDPDSGEYGLHLWEAVDPETGEETLEVVVTPYHDEQHGCDWNSVRPDWLGENGTVLILLGNDPADHTVSGDPNRAEGDIKGVSAYLNRRVWSVPAGVEVFVDEMRTADRSKWPRSAAEAHGPQDQDGYDRRTNYRRIEGACHYIEYPVDSFTKGQLASGGVVTLSDDTEIKWYLWEGERPAVQSYAAIGGYIAALYENEMYDLTTHASTYRSFGISEGEVRKRLWLIVNPRPLKDGGKHGVYPRTDRNALLLKGGPAAGQPLPFPDWGAEFADIMPVEILEAIRASRGTGEGTITDESWRERLAERFGALWRIAKLRVQKGGGLTVQPVQSGSLPRPTVAPKHPRRGGDGGGQGGRGGLPAVGTTPGPEPAKKTRVAGGIPTWRAVHATDIEEGMLASWQPVDPEHPEGVVLLNVDHPVLEAQIERWQSMYPDHLTEDIGLEVVRTFGEIAVAKVAHSEHLKGIIASEKVEKELRSNEALTMSLLGLVAEEAVLATRIGGRFGRKRA